MSFRNLFRICLIFFLCFALRQGYAQTFPCDNGQRFYFFQETGALYGSLSYMTNYISGTPSVTVMFPMPNQQHNALGANPVDKYLYYIEWNTLKRITSAGTISTVCPLASVSLYGCFDHKGRYWTVQSGKLVAIDITTCATVKGPYTLTLAAGFLDIVFNPKDCHLYLGDLKVDTNGVVDPTYPGTQFVPAGTYGGAAMGSDGNIYGTGGTTTVGDLSVINLTTNTSQYISSFSPGPVFSKNDMASFICSSVQAAFSDSLTACNSLTVFFQDSSSGAVGNWSWNFGDPASGTNNSSTQQNPSHVYTSAGTYTVTLVVSTGNNICYPVAADSTTLVVTISASAGLALTTLQNNISCNGLCNGAASVNVSSGNAPYSYNWSTGQSSSAVSGLCAGNYSVSISDASGCTATQTFPITQPAALSSSVAVSPTSCGSPVGSATVSVSGGTASYTYNWQPSGGSSNIATGLGIGTYSCIITDASGCITTALANILNSGAPFVSLNGQSNVLCYGAATGTASVTASGGTPGYTYSWSPSGGSTSAATGLTAGNYVVTVTDGSGCSNLQALTITQPAAITSTISGTSSSCSSSSGTASVNVSGGTGSYTYLWNPSGGSSATASGLSAGNYTVNISDANGCSSSATLTIATLSSPSVTLSGQTNIICNGLNTGTAGVTVSGGTMPFTYSWSPSGGTNASAFGLSAGIYSVAVNDAAGCTSTLTLSITQPPALSAAISSTATPCGNNLGNALITAGGGTGALSFFWQPGGQTTALVSGLSAGTYTATAVDANGCALTLTVAVTQSGGPVISVSPDVTILAGSSSTLSASGGGTYSWNTGDTTSSIVVAPSATSYYLVTVTDTTGCSASDTIWVFVIQPDPCTGTSADEAFFIPNAFTPNGDLENDNICLQGITDCIDEFRTEIYSRWGEKVFETTDKNFCWDGTYNLEKMNTALFTYYIHATLLTGNKKILKGNISLIR